MDIFLGKIKKIRQDLEDVPKYSPTPKDMPILTAFASVKQEEVESWEDNEEDGLQKLWTWSYPNFIAEKKHYNLFFLYSPK